MALSDQINDMQLRLESLQLIFNAVSEKVGQMTECMGNIGAERFAKILEWQQSTNSEILVLQRTLQEYFMKIEQVQNMILNNPGSVVSSISKDNITMITDMMKSGMSEQEIIDKMKKMGLEEEEIRQMMKVCQDDIDDEMDDDEMGDKHD